MAQLNDVRFDTAAGGLGRLPAGADYVSGIITPLGGAFAGFGTQIGKRYTSVEEAERDGITDDAATAELHYQISEYFGQAGASELYVINADAPTYSTQRVFAVTEGRVRQFFYDLPVTFDNIVATVGAAKSLSDGLASLHAPCVVICAVEDEATAITATVPDLRATASQEVAVLVTGSNTGEAAELAVSLGKKYIPAGGAVLGALSRASVHESIGHVERYNFASGAEFLTARLSDGRAEADVAESLKLMLKERGYIFHRARIGVSGTYIEGAYTCTDATSDYAFIADNRVMQKVKRTVRASLLPDLNRSLTLNAQGKLNAATIAYFENKGAAPLDRMLAAGEISAYEVTVDPDQDVAQSGILKLKIRVIPRGKSRSITVDVGYTLNVA